MAERFKSAALATWEDEGGSVAPAPASTGESPAGRRDLNEDSFPSEFADRVSRPFRKFLRIEAASGIALLVATGVAVGLSNSAWSASFLEFWGSPVGVRFGAFDFSRSLQHWINDALMTVFFFVVALELKRELVVGELRQWRTAALSLAGALGGMLVPVVVYVAVMSSRIGSEGWGVVMATDTAFVIGCLALFGSRIPSSLRLFLLSLAIFDDVGAILVVAVGYGNPLQWPAFAAAGLLLSAVFVASRLGMRSMPIYFALGALTWLAFDASGVHATLCGVILGLMTPARAWVNDDRLRSIFNRVLAYPRGEHWSGDTADRAHLQQAGRAARESLSPVEQLEIGLHPWSAFFVMPLFALANAGVGVTYTGLLDRVSIAIILALVLGKPVGVLGFSWLAVRLGVAKRPVSLSWSLLFSGALLTGIGFTMSIFIAGLAFSPPILDAAKVGILSASVIAAAAGIAGLWIFRPRSITRPTHPRS